MGLITLGRNPIWCSADPRVFRVIFGFHPLWERAGFEQVCKTMGTGAWGCLLHSASPVRIEARVGWRNALPHATHIVQQMRGGA